jgi:dihydrofolate reductase
MKSSADVDVAIIVAQSSNRVIGNNNELPWHLPEDLKYFKQVTMGKPIVMGRKTYDSIGRPLPGRKNIVITRQSGWSAEGVDSVSSLSAAIERAKNHAFERQIEEIMIIGGAQIYSEALPLADKLYLTQVHDNVEGDAYFPEFTEGDWQEVERVDHAGDNNGKPNYSFIILCKSV